MIKRTIYIGNPAYLNLKFSQMQIQLPEVEQNENVPNTLKKSITTSIPIEDIGIIILDHPRITLTQALLDALLSNNSQIITCDASHHPVGLFFPLCGNVIQTERFRVQVQISVPLKKQLWAQTVIQKIKNQYSVLKMQNIEGEYLVNLYKNVKSGDTENYEAQAAAYYWKIVFKDNPKFKRSREGEFPNSILNYGYAILRATVARSLVGAGLLPTLGIHHRNRYNAFCLADDIMEPYRPIVDFIVVNILQQNREVKELTKEIKIELLKIPVIDVKIGGEVSPLMNATQKTANSLIKCFSGIQNKILYPELYGNKQ